MFIWQPCSLLESNSMWKERGKCQDVLAMESIIKVEWFSDSLAALKKKSYIHFVLSTYDRLIEEPWVTLKKEIKKLIVSLIDWTILYEQHLDL